MPTRRPSLRSLVILVFATTAAACIPARSVGGVVHVHVGATCGSDTPGGGTMQPVANADVTIECVPKTGGTSTSASTFSTTRQTILKAKTNDAGEFVLQPAPPIDLDCEIIVAAPNMVSRRFAVLDHCASEYSGPIWDSTEHACHNLWLDATLLPKSTSSSPPPPF